MGTLLSLLSRTKCMHIICKNIKHSCFTTFIRDKSLDKFLVISYLQGHYNRGLLCESAPGYYKPFLGISSKHTEDRTEELLR
jgi:hypothetical protein